LRRPRKAEDPEEQQAVNGAGGHGAKTASLFQTIMIVLGIETSCDETAISLIESRNGRDIAVLADKTLSQIELHRKYGGVFPNMAKREHSRNLIPLLKTILEEAARHDLRFKIKDLGREKSANLLTTYNLQLTTILEREPELLEQFLKFIPTVEKPHLDVIAVTEGPGLEPCLWTGINLAKALSLVWDIPIVPVNHMEGHIFSALLRRKDVNNELGIKNSAKEKSSSILHNSDFIIHEPALPAIALLISGGHTELVLVKDWFNYEIVGQTRDDAVGEAFDKVARLLGLPYPGGPEISALAEKARSYKLEAKSFVLPRPMLHSPDFDFSFSGIKTSVLYLLKKLPALTDDIRKEIALEFENAVTEVLIAKTRKAIEYHGAKALLLGGGVVANTHIRRAFEKLSCKYDRTYVAKSGFLHLPEQNLTTDNALMIAVAGYFHRENALHGAAKSLDLKARGNLSLPKHFEYPTAYREETTPQ